MPERDEILKLLKDPLPDRHLYGMSLTELEGLGFGIQQLTTLYREDPKIFYELKSLGSRVGLAHTHVDFMNRLDGFLDKLQGSEQIR